MRSDLESGKCDRPTLATRVCRCSGRPRKQFKRNVCMGKGLAMGHFGLAIRPLNILLPLMAAIGLVPQLYGASAPPSIAEVLEGLQRIEQTVFETKSFYVKYERDEVVKLLNPGIGGLLPAQWTQAFYRDKWYSERRFTRPEIIELPTGARSEVPAAPSIQVLKDGIVLEWDQASQPVVIHEIRKFSNLYGGLNYTRNLSLDAPKYIAQAGKVELAAMRAVDKDNTCLPFLPEYLRANRNKYNVLPQPEMINGIECWILEWPGMDRIAVDAQRGFAIIRRSYSWAPGKPLQVEVTNSDHRQVKPGLWLPFQQHETRYASIVAQPQANWGKPELRARYTVQAMRFDDLDDAFFQVKLPPKMKVFDAVRGFNYEVEGNTHEPFAEAIAAATAKQQAAKGVKWDWKWFGFGIVAAIIVAATVVVYKCRTR